MMGDIADDHRDMFDEMCDHVAVLSCKYCHAHDMHWEEARGPNNRKRWVLMEDGGSIHICPALTAAIPARADEFPDFDKPNPPRKKGRSRRARRPARKAK